jgi:hypothetical protein
VLIVRRANNMRCPTATKRVSWVALRVCVEINGWSLSERPSADEAEQVVLAIAAGEWDRDASEGPSASMPATCQNRAVDPSGSPAFRDR